MLYITRFDMLRRSACLETSNIHCQERLKKGVAAQRWLKRNVISRLPLKLKKRVSAHEALLRTEGIKSPVKANSKGEQFSSQEISLTAIKILKTSPTWTSSPSNVQSCHAKSPGSRTNYGSGLKSGKRDSVVSAVQTSLANTSVSPSAQQTILQTGENDLAMHITGFSQKQTNGATSKSRWNSSANSSPCFGISSDEKLNPVVLLEKLPEWESPVSLTSCGRMSSSELLVRDNVDVVLSLSPAAPEMSGEGTQGAAGCQQAVGCSDCSSFKTRYHGDTSIPEMSEKKTGLIPVSNSTEGLVLASMEIAASERIDHDELGNMLEVCARMAEIHPESSKTPTEQHPGWYLHQHGSRAHSQFQQTFGGTFPKTVGTVSERDEVDQAVRSLMDVTPVQHSTDLPPIDSSVLTGADLLPTDGRQTVGEPTTPWSPTPVGTEQNDKGKVTKRRRGRPRKDRNSMAVCNIGKLKFWVKMLH